LFAGSGALGLEALSRAAAHVTFVEQDAVTVRELRARLAEWGASGARVERGDALRFLAGTKPHPDTGTADSTRPADAAPPFDIVFLDPPFASDLLASAARLLEDGGWLAPGALIYVESDAHSPLPPLPGRWTQVKAKQAGTVRYHLLARARVEGKVGE
jgi:16S rRNA (guanine966-N2)-methyltransferase